MTARPASARTPFRLAIEIGLAAMGAALIAAAVGVDQAWFDRHFLPVFFVTRDQFVTGETLARLAVGAVGLALILVARPLAASAAGRITSPPVAVSGAARIALALALALGASEIALRVLYPLAREEAPPGEEPLRRRDAALGWVFVPSRVGLDRSGGRRVEYAFDAAGDRVPDLRHPVDPTRPTLLFTGESIMCGFGLPWSQSVPALVGAALHEQSANLAVFGYADDQSLMRLAQAAPRFARPTAVVILFSPALMFRDLDTDRPHLAAGWSWTPPIRSWRLAGLARFYVPYLGVDEIDRLIAATRAELTAGVALAHARGATALIVVPQFGRESPPERVLRRRILDEAGLPYVQVALDPAWRLARDPHPDARGARAIAAAIVARLKRDGVEATETHKTVDADAVRPHPMRGLAGLDRRPI